MWMAVVGTSGEHLQWSHLTFDLSWSNLQERNLDLMSEKTFNPKINLEQRVIKQYFVMVKKKKMVTSVGEIDILIYYSKLK